ncbi:hypothetical protein WBG78_24725 [Chryseolinea sp. T2]|uniref:hypothetical protein n=1 Tax=Chryseolinea sp. T2 TaxID=3129255 RepID=UPI0030787230
MKTNRRTFIQRAALCAAPFSLPGYHIQHAMQERPAPLSGDLVLDFVRSAHHDLARVKELLEKEPNLLNATWDWGKGDFESAIGAAGHMGLVDMAEFLISKGARMDIFVATMLGKLDIVKPMLENFPSLKSSKGPHGITLLFHAEKGKERAKPVLDYLKSIGAS